MGYYDYSNEFTYGNAAQEGVAGFILVFVALLYLAAMVFSVVSYVLLSIGYYRIARRRGIYHPWLAWLPIGNMWILGSISDQYQYVAKGRVRNRRKALVWLMVGMYVASICLCIGAFSTMFNAMIGAAPNTATGANVAILLLASMVISVISIVAVILQYMALYDLYASCDPSNKVLYLVLSIVFSVTMPFFVFNCRRKDFGMPPRKVVQPAETPTEEIVVEEQPE